MPFWRSYAHLVWATKNRQPFIVHAIEDQLYGQLIRKAADLGCYVYSINGMPDHLHMVLTTPPKYSVSHVVKMLKGSSAHFVNHVIQPQEFNFVWQRGYGYLTLGESQLNQAMAYVQKQKEHHALHTTNSWLERDSELDEGPVHPQAPPRPGRLEDERVLYEVEAGFPF